MSVVVLAQLAALKTTATADLKAQWRKLNDSEPPPYNRRFLESRLAYRIQELAYGGLKPATLKKLEALGEADRRQALGQAQAAGGRQADRRHPADPGLAGRRAYGHGDRRPATSGRAGRTSRFPPWPAPSPARGGTAGFSSASRTSSGLPHERPRY